jgi:hypothetical protein
VRAAARRIESLDAALGLDRESVVPLELDVTSAESVEAGAPNIYPDEASRGFARIWHSDPRALEASFAAG